MKIQIYQDCKSLRSNDLLYQKLFTFIFIFLRVFLKIGVQLFYNVVLVSTVQRSGVPCAVQQVLISYLFYTYMSIPISQIIPPRHPPFSPLSVHIFVLYICVSISALQTGSSVPFFWIPHICINTCTPVFIAALLTIARSWKQPKCPSTNEWIKKMWYIYTMEYQPQKGMKLGHLQRRGWTQRLIQSEVSQKLFTFKKRFCKWQIASVVH